jgi:hypothetical protein
MLEFQRCKASERKLRLFAVECCRRASHLIFPDREVIEVLEVIERYVDGSASEDEVTAIGFNVMSLEEGGWSQTFVAAVPRGWKFVGCILNGTITTIARMADDIADVIRESANDRHAVLHAPLGEEIQTARAAWTSAMSAWSHERAAQSSLLRDIFGNPFRPVSLDPAWRTWHYGLLVSMARQMYDSRDFSDMAVLADAIEEAGCTNQDILAHCRSGGEHVRGCWVIDALLGKE